MRARVDGVSLWYDVLSPAVVADGERPVLVGVHGGPGIDSWSVGAGLAPLADVAQVIRYDQRGHGRSDAGVAADWTEERWADDLRGLVDALGVVRPVVWGGSFGARVVLTYAARHPGHARALVVSHGGGRMDRGAIVAAMRRLGGERAAQVSAADAAEPGRHHEEWLEVCLPLYSRRPGAAEYFQELHARSIRTPVFLPPPSRHVAGLDRITCPVLLICGAEDPSVPVSVMGEVRERLVNAPTRLVVLPDCGHTVFRDQPDLAHNAIREFLAEVGS